MNLPFLLLIGSAISTLLNIFVQGTSAFITSNGERTGVDPDRVAFHFLYLIPYIFAVAFLLTTRKALLKWTFLGLALLSSLPFYFFLSFICMGYCDSKDKIPLIFASLAIFFFLSVFIVQLSKGAFRVTFLILLVLLVFWGMLSNEAWVNY